jgi:MFS family permease
MMIFMGGTPAGAPVIGWIGQTFGARWTLVLGGLLTIAGVALAAVLFARAKGISVVPQRTPAVPSRTAG